MDGNIIRLDLTVDEFAILCVMERMAIANGGQLIGESIFWHQKMLLYCRTRPTLLEDLHKKLAALGLHLEDLLKEGLNAGDDVGKEKGPSGMVS